MNWREMTIGKKITLGFGIVLILLVAVGTLSFIGVGGIVTNAQEVIYGRNLDGILAQKEVDHLNWVNQVNALLTDSSIHELTVETDHTKCGFGKWLYSDERKAAEKSIPGLAALFKAIETPHHLLHNSAIEIGKIYKTADPLLPSILQTRINDHLKWSGALKETFLQNAQKVSVNLDPTTCGLGKWLVSEQAKKIYDSATPEFRKVWDEMVESHHGLHRSAEEIAEHYRQTNKGLRDLLKDRLIDHKNWARAVSQKIIEGDADLGVQTDPTKCALGHFLTSDQLKTYEKNSPELTAVMAAIHEPHNELHASAISIINALSDPGKKEKAATIFKEKSLPALNKTGLLLNQAIHLEDELDQAQATALSIYDTKTLPILHRTVGALEELSRIAMDNLKGMNTANAIFASTTKPNLVQVQSILGDIRKAVSDAVMTDEVMLNAAREVKRNVSLVGVAAIVLGLLFAFLIVKGIVSVLTSVSDRMNEGANQVSAASSQVSSASQSLAEGSSEQAASVEETSSSLEEMSSMTKKNAENAGEADRLMKDSNAVVTRANSSMEQVTTSMLEITKASEETSKIIKTIDEIAFQTNLLALNAAVEAARAGEAGAGFAVVADEVRNLAMRAAAAAKSTSDLIESTVKKVKDGNKLVEETNDAFKVVAQSSQKVAHLVSEIAAASEEQSQGIEQINMAVVEMDKVIQQNASNSEESAAAAEELDVQAYQLKDAVGDLIKLVGGKTSSGGKRPQLLSGSPRRVPAIEQAHGYAGPRRAKPRKMLQKKSSEVRPEEVIPMDDDDNFENF